MFNKKKIGFGMLIAGGIVTVVGAMVTIKSSKGNKEECNDYCDVCHHADEYDEYDDHYSKEEVGNIPTEWEPTKENVIKARISTSTYNPTAEPVSMSQEDLEACSNTF